jgi:hypothetical protein
VSRERDWVQRLKSVITRHRRFQIFEAAKTFALDNDLAVLRAQFDLANVSACTVNLATAPQFQGYEMTLGLGAHHEDPSSPHFSTAGAECASGGKSVPGASQSNDVAWGRDPIDDLDGLFYDAHFHRLSLFNAYEDSLTRVHLPFRW